MNNKIIDELIESLSGFFALDLEFIRKQFYNRRTTCSLHPEESLWHKTVVNGHKIFDYGCCVCTREYDKLSNKFLRCTQLPFEEMKNKTEEYLEQRKIYSKQYLQNPLWDSDLNRWLDVKE